jgi:hypothetical protein
MASYLLAMAVMVLVLAAWVGTQIAWRKVMGDVGEDPDVLALRMQCHGCECDDKTDSDSTDCSRRRANEPDHETF